MFLQYREPLIWAWWGSDHDAGTYDPCSDRVSQESKRRPVTHCQQFQKLLGLMSAASNVIPFGLLYMRPLQWWRKTKGFSPCHDLGLPLFLSLSHSVVHALTHTHAHMHTDTYISLSLTCLSFQSAFALLCSATCSHSSNQSLYLQWLRSRLSAGLLYVMHSCVLFLS